MTDIGSDQRPARQVEPDQIEPDQIEDVFRQVYGQAVATLVRVFGDITLAEDAVQDAFVVASEKWPHDGIPPNPAGWIITTARNRAIDDLRRSTRGRELEKQAGSMELDAPNDGQLGEEGQLGEGDPLAEDLADDQLRLIFTCCHPALRTENQVALTLRLLGGLSIEEVARSFVVSEPAMAKRLVRAKYKIKAAKIPYRVPSAADLPRRLRPVLSVLYLIYNTGADDPSRASLRGDAVRLARALMALMPDEPEVAGLLALILLTESRIPARRQDGSIVVLRDQMRENWDRTLIDEGHAIVRACVRRNQPGPYQIQAAIQAVHCNAESFEETDWAQIVALYDQLMAVMPTPVVALNRAIALSEVDGPEAALTALDAIDLDSYHLLHASRATMLLRSGQAVAALGAFKRAAELAPTEIEREFLAKQIEELEQAGKPGGPN